MTPPFGMYTALSAQLAGSLRHSHSRLAEFAEEVAFLGGEETEKMLIEREYATVLIHENKVLQRRWWFGCVEEGVIKWLWGSFGVRCLRILRLSDGLTFNSLSYAPFLYFSRSLELSISILVVGLKVGLTSSARCAISYLLNRIRNQQKAASVFIWCV